MSWKILITCEHGGNQIPEAYKKSFAGEEEWLASHRGYDIGALELYTILADALADEKDFSETSRLLVELNRSKHHPNLFSKATKVLPEPYRTEILQKYYEPYRNRVTGKIEKQLKQGNKVLHVAIHFFVDSISPHFLKAKAALTCVSAAFLWEF